MTKPTQFFTSRILPAAACAMLAYALLFVWSAPQRSAAAPAFAPPATPFAASIAGIGITEPKNENISVGSDLSGIVTAIHVKVGDQVKAGDPLFTIDDRDAQSQWELAQAQLAAAKVQAADAHHQLALYEQVSDKRAISDDELSRRRFAAQLADSKIKEAQAQAQVFATAIDRLTVKALADGQVLRINIRPGEFAQAGVLNPPLMILGNTRIMHVRVEIDETDALRVDPAAPAIATLRGYSGTPVKLSFVRKEPFILPKRSLTGDGNERVDTRVQEILYSFDNGEIGAFVGQQMDVFIDAKPSGKE